MKRLFFISMLALTIGSCQGSGQGLDGSVEMDRGESATIRKADLLVAVFGARRPTSRNCLASSRWFQAIREGKRRILPTKRFHPGRRVIGRRFRSITIHLGSAMKICSRHSGCISILWIPRGNSWIADLNIGLPSSIVTTMNKGGWRNNPGKH